MALSCAFLLFTKKAPTALSIFGFCFSETNSIELVGESKAASDAVPFPTPAFFLHLAHTKCS